MSSPLSKLSASLILLVVVLFFSFFSLIYSKTKEYDQKSNFECGFNSKNKYSTSFSLNYFFLTIILIVFDLEILVLLLSVNMEGKIFFVSLMIPFIIFFSALLCFEWSNSILEWS